MAGNESFFRKVVRFVANPTTDWVDLNSRQEQSRELELEKSELKAMIERKRRNDFVRKREFDTLRRVRREGLTPEQLAALGSSSRLDDSEARLQSDAGSRTDGVKAKIDEIEQQMVGDGSLSSLHGAHGGGGGGRPAPARSHDIATRPAALRFDRSPVESDGVFDDSEPPLRALPPLPAFDLPPAAAPAPVQMGNGLPPLAPLAAMSFEPTAPMEARAFGGVSSDFGNPFALEVNEIVHDPELDEAVISFANAEFVPCEDALRRLIGPRGGRHQHAETWLVMFDLYRATGEQQRFETLAIEYAQQFGWSAPQWYSLPRLVAEGVQDEPVRTASPVRTADLIGWPCPPRLDVDAVAQLRSQTLQMPLPWVMDWSALNSIDAEAAAQLSTLFRSWAGQSLDMRWIAGDRLLSALQDAAPTGVRDADPAFWLARLEALRLVNRAVQFDEAAIDYCVTYEVSPPSWEPARCKVRIGSGGLSTRTPSMSMVSDPPSGFVESSLVDDAAGGPVTVQVELSGQLVGDISATLDKLQASAVLASQINVSCTRLIRVDFMAAGDLLNWVMARRTENRTVQFIDAHRLVALFFGAMAITEYAKVQVRRV